MAGYSQGGASLHKKTLKAWRPIHLSAKSDIDANLNLLRGRSASLIMNSAIGQAAIKSSLTGTISSGLKLFPRINAKDLQISAEEARTWSRKVKREFELWSATCDFYKRNNFNELQQIAYQSYLMDGDCFCLFKRSPINLHNPYSLKLQLIEAQRVSNPHSANSLGLEMRGETEGSRIVNGIEVNREGQIEAVWISNRLFNEPSIEGTLEWQRVKVFGESGFQNVLHICKDSRIGQFRGEPYLAPVIETLKQISRFTEAELSSAVNRAFFSIFFTQNLNSLQLQQILGENNVNDPCLDTDDYPVENGSVIALPPGTGIETIDNSKAQSTFDAFTSSLLQQIAAGLNLPVEVLNKKFQNNYSASRAALLQAADEFRQRRDAFVQDFCQPVYQTFLTEAVATGRVKAKGYFASPVMRMLWQKADWFVEGNHLLDVTKEIEGAERRIALGISTRQKEAAELCGTDFYELCEQLKYETELLGDIVPQQKED